MIDKHRIKVTRIVSKLSVENKINLMCQYQDSIPELDLKKYKHGTEASHGISWLGKATMFPQPIGLAATWDKKLMKEVGEVIGIEARGFFDRDPEINGLTLWAPTVDLNRDPRWGRTDEGYGEDPILVGNLAASLITGIQGDDPNFFRAAATLKHFYGNNNEIDRGFSSTDISERIKREYYLKVFKIVIEKSRVMSMMTAYNSVNGIPANIHPDLQNIIRDEWDWKGFVVSDAGDVISLINEHKYVDNPVDAVALSIKAGIDSITDDHDVCKKSIKDALACGKLVEADLDKAISRGLIIRSILGEFDNKNPYSSITEDVIGLEEHGEKALRAAKKSIILLKNSENILPLTSNEIQLSVVGNMVDRVYRDWYSGDFLYQITAEQGLKKYYNNVEICDGNDRVLIQDKKTGLYLQTDGSFNNNSSIFEMEDWGWGAVTFKSADNNKYLTSSDDSISATADSIWGWFTKEVFYSKTGNSVEIKTWNNVTTYTDNNRLVFKPDGASDGDIGISASTPVGPVYTGKGEFNIIRVSDGIKDAVKLACITKNPIVIIGNHPLINGKETIDRHDLKLPSRQYELALRVVEANKNSVLILVGSYPYAIGELKDRYKAIISTSHLGQESGNALMEILSGKENPGGRLPITCYKSMEDLGNIKDYELPDTEKTYLYFKGEVEFPFGHGLGYSNMIYKELQCSSTILKDGDNINISFKITNSGPMDGDEVIQIYIKHYGDRVKRPVKQLIEFDRVFIKNAETLNFVYSLPSSEFKYWCEEDSMFNWEPGRGEIILGSSSMEEITKIELQLI